MPIHLVQYLAYGFSGVEGLTQLTNFDNALLNIFQAVYLSVLQLIKFTDVSLTTAQKYLSDFMKICMY